ncbi:hypothetical protein [Vibrio cidicii]
METQKAPFLALFIFNQPFTVEDDRQSSGYILSNISIIDFIPADF